MVALPPAAIAPRLHWTDPGKPEQEPREALWKVTDKGSEIVARAPEAAAGPLFRTTTW